MLIIPPDRGPPNGGTCSGAPWLTRPTSFASPPAVRRVGRSTGRPTREGLSLRPVSGPPSTTDALRGTIAIHDHGLTTVGLRMVWAETMAINEPSRSVIVKPRMRW